MAIYSEWLEFRYCLAFDDKIRSDDEFTVDFSDVIAMSDYDWKGLSKCSFGRSGSEELSVFELIIL